MQRHVSTIRGLLAGFALLAGLASAYAQTPSAQPAPAPSQLVTPDAEKIVLLLRGTILTLNDALQSGNFTVLRDVAAPAFRDANSAARLGVIFGNLMQRGIDLSVVAVLAPQLSEAPTIDPQSGMLRIKGSFPGQPVRIDFEVIYQSVAGRWRMFGLSVQPITVGPPETAAIPQQQQPAPAAKPSPAKSATPPSANKAETTKK